MSGPNGAVLGPTTGRGRPVRAATAIIPRIRQASSVRDSLFPSIPFMVSWCSDAHELRPLNPDPLDPARVVTVAHVNLDRAARGDLHRHVHDRRGIVRAQPLLARSCP